MIALYLLMTLPFLLTFFLFAAACATFVAIQKLAGGVDKVILHHADEYQAKSTKLDWPQRSKKAKKHMAGLKRSRWFNILVILQFLIWMIFEWLCYTVIPLYRYTNISSNQWWFV